MLLLEAQKIEKSYGDRLLIKVDNLQVYHGERIGIVGKNGEGKSTLLKMFVGEVEPDQGVIQRFCSIAYIPQFEMIDATDLTLKEKNGWNIPQEESSFLSGGEETRKKLAFALSSNASLIIADEPTSHLDVEGVEKLENELKCFDGGLLIISHDRELLNQICTSIWEVEAGGIRAYQGNYESYLVQKQREEERQWFEYEQYIKEKKRLEHAALEQSQKSKSLKKAPSRMGNSEARLHKRSVGQKKAKLDKGVKAIESRINHLEKKSKPKTEDEINFDINGFRQLHSKTAMSLRQVCAKVEDRVLFSELNGTIKPGLKIAISGSNGVGKSTLLKMINNRAEGITIAKPANIGYFHQQLKNLDDEKTILENVQETSNYTENFIRTVLSRLLFKRDDVQKEVGVLSGGERVKTALAKVFLGDYNILLLDEPTNYLDLQTKEALQSVLQAYPGTIIFVTHDRFFIKKLATHVLLIRSKTAVMKDVNHVTDSMNPVEQTDEIDSLAINLELTEIISKLSIVSCMDEKLKLERKYEDLLRRRKLLNE